MLFNAGDWLYLKILRRQKRHGGEKEKERKSGARKSENGYMGAVKRYTTGSKMGITNY